MSQENVETLKRGYDAYNRGDLEGALESTREDTRWDMSERVLNPAVLEGREAFRRDFNRLGEAWDEFRYDPEEFIEVSASRVLVLGHVRGRGRGSGVEVELFSAHLWDFADDEVVGMRLYRDREDALEAAGQRE